MANFSVGSPESCSQQGWTRASFTAEWKPTFALEVESKAHVMYKNGVNKHDLHVFVQEESACLCRHDQRYSHTVIRHIRTGPWGRLACVMCVCLSAFRSDHSWSFEARQKSSMNRHTEFSFLCSPLTLSVSLLELGLPLENGTPLLEQNISSAVSGSFQESSTTYWRTWMKLLKDSYVSASHI